MSNHQQRLPHAIVSLACFLTVSTAIAQSDLVRFDTGPIPDTIPMADLLKVQRIVVFDGEFTVLDYLVAITDAGALYKEFHITSAELPEQIKQELLSMEPLTHRTIYLEDIHMRGENGVSLRAPTQKFVIDFR